MWAVLRNKQRSRAKSPQLKRTATRKRSQNLRYGATSSRKRAMRAK
jgi:hypothetical protein